VQFAMLRAEARDSQIVWNRKLCPCLVPIPGEREKENLNLWGDHKMRDPLDLLIVFNEPSMQK
jgi:hypothetical protein